MNEIRKNKDVEVDVIKMSFKLEPMRYLIDIFKIIVAGAISGALIFLAFKVNEVAPFGIIFGGVAGVFCIAFLVGLILKSIGCKKSEISISNRRIYGKYGPYLVKKTFSYRLDEINNVELKDVFGTRTIIINFQDGKGPFASPQVRYGRSASRAMMGLGVFQIFSVENYKEVYEKLTELLLSLKNNVDLDTDIRMAKLDAEQRKAEAIEKLANRSTGASENKGDYIDEIKRLKELLDAGIITKEEFDNEKKEILDNNHK